MGQLFEGFNHSCRYHRLLIWLFRALIIVYGQVEETRRKRLLLQWVRKNIEGADDVSQMSLVEGSSGTR